MKFKTLIFFVVIELSIITVGVILGILISDTKKKIQNIECSVDYCEEDKDENEEEDEEEDEDDASTSSTRLSSSQAAQEENDGDGEEENIRITSPQPNDIVSSPLVITGEARGTWYFEGDFPVDIYNEACIKIGESYASAQEFWMVEDFVPFQGTIEFDPGNSTTGTLVLEKASLGCMLYYDNLLVPVRFE